ncbi:MAG: hypothetical protein MUP63_00330 [Candidatus Nanohaloarchaeota archaeon QJJ-7]|nr:hypothetical protein [Candidatus Nanohaloarchaeota archaeon QJJ-7]
MKRFLILNGVHTAGKTSVGRYLEECGFTYQSEMATQLIESEGYDAGKDADHEFQKEIYKRERERDRDLLESEMNSIIETWHIGNIAHSREVSEDGLVEEHQDYLGRLQEREDLQIAAIYINISVTEIMNRTDFFSQDEKEEVEDFFDSIHQNIMELYETYDIPHVKVDNPPGRLPETKETAEDIAESFFDESINFDNSDFLNDS